MWEKRKRQLEEKFAEGENQKGGNSSSSGRAEFGEVEVRVKPRINMIRFTRELEEPRITEEPKTPEVKEQPKTTELSEEARKEDRSVQQKGFEKIHEELVYDTIEQNLSNLIDIEPEGIHVTREMTIELEKKMTFQFRVHTPHPKELKECQRGSVRRDPESRHLPYVPQRPSPRQR